MLKKLAYCLILVVLVASCKEEAPKRGAGKFGMLDQNTPEFAATEFFNQIYHTKDLSGALKLSSPSMARLLRSYHTNKAVQKHVLNMRFDKVEIQPSTRSAGRNEFAQEAQISLFFEGKLNGNVLKDLRVIELVKVKDIWKVNRVSEG